VKKIVGDERFMGIAFSEDFDSAVESAVEQFWRIRREQYSRQRSSGKQDHGTRGAVTGGKQLDGFVQIVKDALILNGVPSDSIFTDSALELPGYYRPNKKWDLLVVDSGELLAAVELKSQVGPSFGNNFNNRTEEALGSAADLWTAYREGVFGVRRAPWLGYFMLLEDCPESDMPIRVKSPHFEVLKEFETASYKKRYEIFCGKLLLERQYSGVCFMTTSENDGAATWDCPKPDLSFRVFVKSMLSDIAAR
jgi:hypothetical protein